MLSEAELRLLTTLDGARTIAELASRLDLSLDHATAILERLEKADLVEKERRKNQTQVRLSNPAAVETMQEDALEIRAAIQDDTSTLVQ